MSDENRRLSFMVLVFLAALAAVGCEGGTSGGGPGNGATFAVRRGPLVFTASCYGELKAKSSIGVFAPTLPETPWLNLTVATVLNDGTEVKAGDVVLTFDRVTIEEELRQKEINYSAALADVHRTEQNLDKERIDLELQVERNSMLLEKMRLNVVEGVNYKSKIEVEAAKLDVEKAEIELELAKKVLTAFAKKRAATLEPEVIKVERALKEKKGLEAALGKMEVRATASGMLYRPLTQLNNMNNERVAPGKIVRGGDRILELPDLGVFEAHLVVRQRDAVLVSVGDEATVFAAAAPNKALKGHVVRKDSFATTRNERLGTKTAEGNLKEIIVVVELGETSPELRPGGSVRAEIRSTLVKDAVLAPLAALREPPKEGRTSVALAGGASRAIKIGQTTTTFAEVLEGLEPGEEVVLGEPEPPATPTATPGGNPAPKQ